MDKPELVKCGIYRKVIQRSSPNNDLKGTLKALEIKLDELREIKPAGKFLNEQDIQPAIRKSMLARAAQEETKIISSTPHHTKKQNEAHFFNNHLSVILSPISIGRQSNTAPKELTSDNSPKDNKRSRQNHSSNDVLSKNKKNCSQDKHNSSVIYVDSVNDRNQEEIKATRRCKKDQRTNRSRVCKKVNANSKKTFDNEIISNLHKSHETEADESPQNVLLQSPARLITKLSRIPVRAASQDVEKDTRNSPSDTEHISRSKSESTRPAKSSKKRNETFTARQILVSPDNSIRNLRSRKNSTLEPTPANNLSDLKTLMSKRLKNTSKNKEDNLDEFFAPTPNKSQTRQSGENTSLRRNILTSPTRNYATRSFSKQHCTDLTEAQNTLITEPQVVSSTTMDDTLKRHNTPVQRINSFSPNNKGNHNQKKSQISAETKQQSLLNRVGHDDESNKTLTKINDKKDNPSSELSGDSFDDDFVNKTPRRRNYGTASLISQKVNENIDIPTIIVDVAGTKTDLINKSRPSAVRCKPADKHDGVGEVITRSIALSPFIVHNNHQETRLEKSTGVQLAVEDSPSFSNPYNIEKSFVEKPDEPRPKIPSGIHTYNNDVLDKEAHNSSSDNRSCLINEISARKEIENRENITTQINCTTNSNTNEVDTEDHNSSNNDFNCLINEISIRKQNRDKAISQIHCTTNRGIQTSFIINPNSSMDNSLQTRPLPPSPKAVGQMTQTSIGMSKKRTDCDGIISDSNSRSSHCSSSKLSEVNSSSGAASDILVASYNNQLPRYSQIQHNIFESLDEGDELDDWDDNDFDEPDLTGSCNRTKPNNPWRFVNDGFVPEKMKSFSLNFIPKENEMRSCRSNLCNTSNEDSGLSCGGPKNEKTRNSNASTRSRSRKSLFRRDTILSRTVRRQYTKRNQKMVEGTSEERKTQSENDLLTNEFSAATNPNENESSEIRVTPSTENEVQIPSKHSHRGSKPVTSPRKTISDQTFVSKASLLSKKPVIPEERGSESSGISLSSADKRLLEVEELRQPILRKISIKINNDLSNTKETKTNRKRSFNLVQNKPTDEDKDQYLENVEKVAETNNNESSQPNPRQSADKGLLEVDELEQPILRKITVRISKNLSNTKQTETVENYCNRNMDLHQDKPTDKEMDHSSNNDVENIAETNNNLSTQPNLRLPARKTNSRNLNKNKSKNATLKSKRGRSEIDQDNILDDVSGDSRPKRNRKPVRYLTDIVVNDQNKLANKKRVTSNPSLTNKKTKKIKTDSLPNQKPRSKKGASQQAPLEHNIPEVASLEANVAGNNSRKAQNRNEEDIRNQNNEEIPEQEPAGAALESCRGKAIPSQDTEDVETNIENNSMPPPKGRSMSNSAIRIRSRKNLFGDSSGIRNSLINNYSRTRSSTAKKTKLSVNEHFQNNQGTIAHNVHETGSEYSAQPAPEDCIENTYTSERGSMIKRSSTNGPRVLEGVFLGRGLEQSLSSSEDFHGSNIDASSSRGTSRLTHDDYIKYIVEGKLYSLRFLSRKPSDVDYKQFGNLDVTQTVKCPVNRFSAGHIRLGPGEQKRPTVTTKYSFQYNVLSGLARVQVHNRVGTVHPGDFITVPVGVEYSIQNIDTKSDLIISYTKILA